MLVVSRTEKSFRDAVEDLSMCLESADGDMFRTANKRLIFTSAVPAHTRMSYGSDKFWFTSELKQLRW